MNFLEEGRVVKVWRLLETDYRSAAENMALDEAILECRAGAKDHIGCCCEAFYRKHRDELEDVGVPGIFIDIDDQTCYDLGREEVAYEGIFEAQTQLRIGLLSKLLSWINNNRNWKDEGVPKGA